MLQFSIRLFIATLLLLFSINSMAELCIGVECDKNSGNALHFTPYQCAPGEAECRNYAVNASKKSQGLMNCLAGLNSAGIKTDPLKQVKSGDSNIWMMNEDSNFKVLHTYGTSTISHRQMANRSASNSQSCVVPGMTQPFLRLAEMRINFIIPRTSSSNLATVRTTVRAPNARDYLRDRGSNRLGSTHGGIENIPLNDNNTCDINLYEARSTEYLGDFERIIAQVINSIPEQVKKSNEGALSAYREDGRPIYEGGVEKVNVGHVAIALARCLNKNLELKTGNEQVYNAIAEVLKAADKGDMPVFKRALASAFSQDADIYARAGLTPASTVAGGTTTDGFGGIEN